MTRNGPSSGIFPSTSEERQANSGTGFQSTSNRLLDTEQANTFKKRVSWYPKHTFPARNSCQRQMARPHAYVVVERGRKQIVKPASNPRAIVCSLGNRQTLSKKEYLDKWSIHFNTETRDDEEWLIPTHISMTMWRERSKLWNHSNPPENRLPAAE
jgi:hypothetical protein